MNGLKSDMTGRVAPVENIPLNERVYRSLRDAIISGRFLAGESLALRPLAAELGTSVMPVREAVHRLATQHALELLPNRTIRVPVLSLERFEQMCAVRKLMEGDAAFQAARNMSKRDIALLRAINEQIEDAIGRKDLDAIFAANRDFHFSLYGFAGNEFMSALIETCWLTAGPYLAAVARYVPEPGGQRKVGLTQHDHLLAALEARNAEKARETLIGDIEETEIVVRRHLTKFFEEDPQDHEDQKPGTARRPRRE